jgi:hypothetical protein
MQMLRMARPRRQKFFSARGPGLSQNGDRPGLDLRLRIGGIGPIGGDVHLAGMPLPVSDRAVDILDTYIAAIRETNVDPIADALVDDGGDRPGVHVVQVQVGS